MANEQSWTLTLRQQDVKQTWDVRINDQLIGRLVRDENDLRTDFEIPAGTLVNGRNRLTIRQAGRTDPDDIRVGEIQIHSISPHALRQGATLEVVITDQDDLPIPGRITVVDSAGIMMPLGRRRRPDWRSAKGWCTRRREPPVRIAAWTIPFVCRSRLRVQRRIGGSGIEIGRPRQTDVSTDQAGRHDRLDRL